MGTLDPQAQPQTYQQLQKRLPGARQAPAAERRPPSPAAALLARLPAVPRPACAHAERSNFRARGALGQLWACRPWAVPATWCAQAPASQQQRDGLLACTRCWRDRSGALSTAALQGLGRTRLLSSCLSSAAVALLAGSAITRSAAPKGSATEAGTFRCPGSFPRSVGSVRALPPTRPSAKSPSERTQACVCRGLGMRSGGSAPGVVLPAPAHARIVSSRPVQGGGAAQLCMRPGHAACGFCALFHSRQQACMPCLVSGHSPACACQQQLLLAASRQLDRLHTAGPAPVPCAGPAVEVTAPVGSTARVTLWPCCALSASSCQPS